MNILKQVIFQIYQGVERKKMKHEVVVKLNFQFIR